MTDLATALFKLARFRASWHDGDVIDEGSGLTVGDLDTIIALAPALALDVKGMPIDGLTEGPE